jgi:hypothetical protein
LPHIADNEFFSAMSSDFRRSHVTFLTTPTNL